MKIFYTFLSLLLVLSSFLPAALYAQTTSVAAYTFAAGNNSYVPLATATKPENVGDSDDGYYNAIPIGFPFRFRGTSYTTVSANTNGFMLLGQNGKTTNPGFQNDLATGGNAMGLPIIAALWDDLNLRSGGFRTQISGTAPNRVFTAEWFKVKWDFNATDVSMNFEVKLYEGTNVVQFHYDRVGGVSFLNNPSASIGLAGAVNEFLSVGGTPGTPNVSSTIATNDIDSKPMNNRVFTFTPPAFAPLPVELVEFAAKRRSNTAVALVWVTAMEKNNAGFGIEKSTNGREFREAAFVAGAGNSATSQVYAFLDTESRAVYYRLRQQDLDGTTTFSPVQFVAGAADKPAALALYPNPAKGAVQVRNAAPDSPLTLVDALGRPVRTFTAGAASLDLSGVAAGLYWLRTPTQRVRLVVE